MPSESTDTIYLEHKPSPQLTPYVSKLWYVRTPHRAPGRQRVLPSGTSQIVINLARDFCSAYAADGRELRQPPSLLIGLQREATQINLSDMDEAIGIVFLPGGLRPFFAESMIMFRFRETNLDAIWGPGVRRLRERLQEGPNVRSKFALLEQELLMRQGKQHTSLAVSSAIHALNRGSSASASVDRLAIVT